MKALFSISFCFIFYSIILGQNYGNVWQFGNGVGLDFNGCDPVVISGSNSGFEGCSSISDSDGNLQFYTNSIVVWNSAHQPMPNGQLHNAQGTMSQVIIIAKPDFPELYYIVTTKIQASGTLSLQYHEVDMNLAGGLGDVTEKNIPLSNLNITEQIAASYHSNGTDIWLMTHEYGSNNFLAYLVSAVGISPAPVISSIGPSHVPCTSNINARGEIKFSPDGNKLAFNGNGIGGLDSSNILTLFDFNSGTGMVSNPLDLPFSRGEYGLSFSPDNSKLYGTTWKAFGFSVDDRNYLYQFDLSAGSSEAIVTSKVIIDSLPAFQRYGTLKIGPDGKIYVRWGTSVFLAVINSPNEAGFSSNYDRNAINIGSAGVQYGLNNYIEYVQYCGITNTSNNHKPYNNLLVFPNPFQQSTRLETHDEFMNVSLTMYNSLGQQVNTMNGIYGKSVQIDRGNLPSGIYFIRLIAGGRILTTEKVCIVD